MPESMDDFVSIYGELVATRSRYSYPDHICDTYGGVHGIVLCDIH